MESDVTSKRLEQFSLEEKDWLRNRSQNVFWTVLGDYEKELPKLHRSAEQEKARYQAVVWGAIFLYLDIELIKEFVVYLRSKPDFYSAFYQIFWIAMQEHTIPKLCLERPAIRELFDDFYRAYLKEHERNLPKDSAEIIERGYYSEQLGELDKTNVWLKALFGDTREMAQKAEDTKELIAGVETLYRNYFKTENWIDKLKGRAEISDLSNRKTTPFKPDESFMGKKRGVAPTEFYVEKIVDAEFNPNSFRGKPSKEHMEEERQKGIKMGKSQASNKQSDFEKVWLYFGDLLLPLVEIERMEQRISKGIHEHKKLYITDGTFSEVFSEYQIRFLEEQRNLNLEYLEVHYRACRRHIESLRSMLVNALLPDNLEERHLSGFGNLRAGEVWRAELFRDNKIFDYTIKNEIGNYAVEILLDGSGSQSERQAKVAMQGYIISQALSLCHIPCRISAYATFLDYTILRVYKDFDDTIEKNKKVFDFFGTGMNRDGYALRAVGDIFRKRPEENKILIVLSDGRPNDVRVFKKNAANPDEEEYTGDKAIQDTAMEIRKLRLQGISVLGVFNGEENDLPAQQKIYGKDFAYIKNINQFSKVVGTYLKKELRRFM